MEEILKKLSEIETTAQKIMEDAASKKQGLSEETERACKEYDTRLEKETDAQIRKIRTDLEQEKDDRLTALRQNTEEAFKELDSYYEKNHESLSRHLFEQIISL